MPHTPIDSSSRIRSSSPRQSNYRQDLDIHVESGPSVAPNDRYLAHVRSMEAPSQHDPTQISAYDGAGINPGGGELYSHLGAPQSEFSESEYGAPSTYDRLTQSTSESSQSHVAESQFYDIGASVESTDLWTILQEPLNGQVTLRLANGTLKLTTPPNDYNTVIHEGTYSPHKRVDVFGNSNFVDFAPEQPTLSEKYFNDYNRLFQELPEYEGFEPLTVGLTPGGRLIIEDGNHRFAAAMANNVTVDISLDVERESTAIQKGSNWSEVRFGPKHPPMP